MSTLPQALTTKERIKDQLQITVNDFDNVLDRMIAGATFVIENYCNRRFKQTTYTQEIYDGSYVDGTSKKILTLKNAPIKEGSLTSFQYRTGSKTNALWTELNPDNYQENYETGQIMGYIPSGYRNLRITYIGGYLIDFANGFDITKHTLPHDISDLCEKLVIRRFKKRDSEGRSSETFGESSVTWKDELTETDKAVLADYQRFILA